MYCSCFKLSLVTFNELKRKMKEKVIPGHFNKLLLSFAGGFSEACFTEHPN